MTVKEVMEALAAYPPDANVYVPDHDGTSQIAKCVNGLVHTCVPDGIVIPDDVCITPWTDEEFYEKFSEESA